MSLATTEMQTTRGRHHVTPTGTAGIKKSETREARVWRPWEPLCGWWHGEVARPLWKTHRQVAPHEVKQRAAT